MGSFTPACLGLDSLKKLWGSWLALRTVTITIITLTISDKLSKRTPYLNPTIVTTAATFIPGTIILSASSL